MRISLIAAAGAFAAWVMFPAVAKADERITVRVVANLSLPDTDREVFRSELDARLRAFATAVQAQAALGRPVVAFNVTVGEQLTEDVAATAAGKNNTIALMFGEPLRAPSAMMRAQARIYLGRSPARAALRYQENLFVDVRGRVARDGSRRADELDLYELLIGYALLRREWSHQTFLVGPLASVLHGRIESALGHGSVGSSPCLDWLRSGVREIELVSLHLGPTAREPLDNQISCAP